jgi:hypothetical protein
VQCAAANRAELAVGCSPDLSPLSTFKENEHHQKLREVEPHLWSLFPSQTSRRNDVVE